GLMERMKPYDAAFYDKMPIAPYNAAADLQSYRESMSNLIPYTQLPSGSEFIVAEANNIRTKPFPFDTKNVVRRALIGEKFIATTLDPNGWVQIVGTTGESYWYPMSALRSTNLVKLKSMATISDGTTVIASVTSGSYLRLVLENGLPVTMGDQTKVYTADNKVGWIASSVFVKV
ncbi:MAG: hypothetical protein ACRCWQ_14960, partial [Bacilli bacterium]